jgi:hypothetical protein
VLQFHKLAGRGNGPGADNDKFMAFPKGRYLSANILYLSPGDLIGFLGEGIGAYF